MRAMAEGTAVRFSDGLRGIAIGLVLWFHLWQVSWLDPHIKLGNLYVPFIYLPISGFLGVELFFFISAFCLSYPYVRAHFAQRSLPTIKHFAYRRFIKIVPSYVLSIVVVLLLAPIPGNGESFGANVNWRSVPEALGDLAAHLTFLHTYFYDTYASINGVLWTLGIEVQFYLIFPLLILALLRAPLAVPLILTAIAAGYRVHIGQCCRTPVFDHNIDQLLGFLDYFAMGMLCAYAYEWLRLRKPRLAGMHWLWTLVALGSIAVVVVMFQNLEHHRTEDHFAEWWVIRNGTFYSLAILGVALGSLFAFPAWHKIVANPVLVFFSVISYNLYLWHQVLVRWVATLPFPHATAHPRDEAGWEWMTAIGGFVVAVGVATLITYKFERPLLRMPPEEFAARCRRLFRRGSELPGAAATRPE